MIKIIFFTLMVLAGLSCSHSHLLADRQEENFSIKLKKMYSPCCGWCAVRISTRNGPSEESVLIVNCDPQSENSSFCLEYGVGTQKQGNSYDGKKLIAKRIYLPLYDTMLLKLHFPKMENNQRFFREQSNEVKQLALNNIDTLLIRNVLNFDTTKLSCNSRYLNYIKGYFLYKEL